MVSPVVCFRLARSTRLLDCHGTARTRDGRQPGFAKLADFIEEECGALMDKAHGESDVDIIEAECFFATHANGDRHFNCAVRAQTQFRRLV